jgi:hypothetical protein
MGQRQVRTNVQAEQGALATAPVRGERRASSLLFARVHWRASASTLLLGGVLGLPLAGCVQLKDALQGAGIEPPDVSLEDLAMVKMPGQPELRAYFCPRVLSGRLGLGETGAAMVCSGFFGPAPATDELGLSFDLALRLKNPNRVPLPLHAIATAVTLFPGQEQSQLGTTCLKLCSAADPGCRSAEQDACAGATDVTRGGEVANAVGKLLVAEGARLASGEPLDLKAPKVLPDEELAVVVRFSLAPQQLLPLVQQLAQRSAEQLAKGEAVSFDIPYALSGKVFADGGSAGLLSVPFGPVEGDFEPLGTGGVARSGTR